MRQKSGSIKWLGTYSRQRASGEQRDGGSSPSSEEHGTTLSAKRRFRREIQIDLYTTACTVFILR